MRKVALMAILSVLAVRIWGETAEIDGRTWTYAEEGGVWKIKSVSPATGDLVVPCILGGKYVPTIAANAFSGCWGIDSVTVSVGITNIEEGAFSECKYMRRVSLPKGLKVLYPRTFKACCELDDVVVPDGVEIIGHSVFMGCVGLTRIDIPESVRVIGDGAFLMCVSLKDIRLPSKVEEIHEQMFYNCTSLTNVTFGSALWVIRDEAFAWCSELEKLTIPEFIEYFGPDCFAGCESIKAMDFEGWPPEFVGDPCLPKDLHIRFNVENAEEWAELIGEYGFTNAEAYFPDKPQPPTPPEPTVVTNCIAVTVTNVIVQYVFNSIQPNIAVPQTSEAGYVNVLTEIKGGAVAVPSSWADNYPRFRELFGDDFAAALTKTIKKDGSGNPVFVWQDFVAGTDPTDADSKFVASITLVGGEPVVSWSPELKPEQAVLRKYTVLGKTRLYDEKWSVVDGDAGKYGFFKVTVEMR